MTSTHVTEVQPKPDLLLDVFQSEKDIYLFDQVYQGYIPYQMQLVDKTTSSTVPLTTLNSNGQT